ncbi:MAG: oxygen-independent coproporphyrinogen III oxidase [Bacteroidota bacterium]
MNSPFTNVDLSLLRKYDRPGPRYTSYPTAPLFSNTFTASDFREEILLTNPPDAAGDVSLYLHFPFCDTLCYFCGCTMLVTRDRNRIEEYNGYLKKEIGLIAPLLAAGRRVVQVHWGGGTPTHLSPDQIRDIGASLRNGFRIAFDAEMSVEVDPRELTWEHLVALHDAGFSRMSMGVQDFDQRVQRSVNRVQPEPLTRQVYDWARGLGFDSINVDLIYGLPHQSRATFETTLRKVIGLAPDRIAVFNYAHVPWLKPHQKLIRAEDIPSADQKLEILKMTIELLSGAGYEYIGMDHFAAPGDELARARREKTLYRNFQGYSTKSGADLYGLGMSAISHFGDVYAQNAKGLPEYFRSLDEGRLATRVGYRMNEDDRLRKFVIMRLMCDLEVDMEAVERRFGIDFDTYFAPSLSGLREFEAEGLVSLGEGKIQVIGAGRLLLRNIAMCFDAYLESMAGSKPVFSRTV